MLQPPDSSHELPAERLEISVEPDLVLPLRIYVRSPDQDLPPQSDFTMTITDGTATASTDVRFEAPEKQE